MRDTSVTFWHSTILNEKSFPQMSNCILRNTFIPEWWSWWDAYYSASIAGWVSYHLTYENLEWKYNAVKGLRDTSVTFCHMTILNENAFPKYRTALWGIIIYEKGGIDEMHTISQTSSAESLTIWQTKISNEKEKIYSYNTPFRKEILLF